MLQSCLLECGLAVISSLFIRNFGNKVDLHFIFFTLEKVNLLFYEWSWIKSFQVKPFGCLGTYRLFSVSVLIS